MRISDGSSDVCSSDLLDVLGATQTPEHCPERQRAMCDSILFKGKGDLEEWLAFVALQGSKSFPEPSWASKKINYGNWHASNPPLGSFPNEIGRASCRERVCQYV